MTGFLIALGVFVALVVVMGVRHDRRQRGLGPRSRRRTPDRTRIENQTRADRWGS